jgi:hypothetical protein
MKWKMMSFLLVIMLIASVLAGCNMPAGQTTEKQTENQSGVITVKKSGSYDSQWGPYWDFSGRVEVTYYTKSVVGWQNSLTVTVPDDSVCIGGGAYTEYSGNPGFLTGSWPSMDLKSWNGQSKDHVYYGPHTLTVVAVGLKLIDITGTYYISADVVKKNFLVTSSTSNASTYPREIVYSDPCVTISGGACVLEPFSNYGSLLTGTFYEPTYWYATSKSHLYEDPKQIVSYAIQYCSSYPIVGFGRLFMDVVRHSSISTSASTKGVIKLRPRNGSLIVGVGGQTDLINDINYGRLLTAASPYFDAQFNSPSSMCAYVADTDFVNPYAGQLNLTSIEIRTNAIAESIPGGNYRIKNRWTGEYLYDGYGVKASVGSLSTNGIWRIDRVNMLGNYYIKNTRTTKYLTVDGVLSSAKSTAYINRYTDDRSIVNAPDPTGYYSISGLHIENRLGYVESMSYSDLPIYWWSKDWYLEKN